MIREKLTSLRFVIGIHCESVQGFENLIHLFLGFSEFKLIQDSCEFVPENEYEIKSKSLFNES